MGTPTKPAPGDLHIDASAVQAKDLTTEAIKTASKVREGYEKALANLARMPAAFLERAGISKTQIDLALHAAVNYEAAKSFIPAAEKLLELMRDTVTAEGHIIAGVILESADQARKRAKRDAKGDEILAPLQETFDYQYGPAAKATNTKEKKKKGEK